MFTVAAVRGLRKSRLRLCGLALLAALLAALLCMVSAGFRTAAQEAPPPESNRIISESDFWKHMQTTQDALDDSVADTETMRADIQALWENVSGVQIGDTVLPVDMGWITDALDDADETQAARRHLRALIDSRDGVVRDGGEAGTSPPLDALREVLNDPRFQYGAPTPVPTDEPRLSMPDIDSTPLGAFAQIVGIIALIVVAIIVVAYVSRMINVQPNTLETNTGEDEPTTSTDARARADSFEANRDYRTAIRYLFLALLLHLDERGLIHYDPTLTNREHVRQVTANPQAAELLRQIVGTFEDVWYGFERIDETGYQRFVRQVDRLNTSPVQTA